MTKTNKAEIISVALELFRQRGFHGTSMKDVGQACGLLKGSLYNHIHGKGALLKAALDETDRYFLGAVLTEPNLNDDWRVRAKNQVDRAAAYLEKHHVCAMMHLAFDLPSLPSSGSNGVITFFDNWQRALADILSEGLSNTAAVALAQDTISALEGATLWRIVHDDCAPLQRAVSAFRKIVSPAEQIDLSLGAKKVLARHNKNNADEVTPLVAQLAEALFDAEARALDAEVSIWRQAEAESCFNGPKDDDQTS